MATKTRPQDDTDQQFDRIAQGYYDDEFRDIAAREQTPDDDKEGAGDEENTSPKEIAQAEGSPEADGMYSGNKDKPDKKRKLSIRKRAAFAAGIAGLGGGGLLFFFVFIMPSAHLMHLAETLKLDFSSNEESSDKSLYRLFKAARTGNLGLTRVTWLGEKVFSGARAQLADIGITFQENSTFGNLRTTTIDITKHPALQGMTRDQARTFLAREFGIPEAEIKNLSDRKLAINNRKVGISTTRNIVRSSLAHLSGGKIVHALRMRNITRYWNLPSLFHPWKRAEAGIERGLATRAEAKAREKARKLKVSEYISPGGEGEIAKKNLQEKFRGPAALIGGVLTFTGVACVVRDSADDVVTYNREIIAIPAAVGAAETIAMGSQMQAGTDFTLSQLSDASLLLSDESGDVFDSRALQAKSNPFVTTGVALPIEYVQAFGGATANTLRNLGGGAMAAACSEIGQGIQLTIGLGLLIAAIPTGGGSALGFYGLKQVGAMAVGAATLAGLHHLLVTLQEADPISDDIAATVKGGVLAYGSRELANVTARSGGGVDLGAGASQALDIKSAQADQKSFQARPLFARIFDVTDRRSLASTIIDRQSTSPGLQLQNMAAGLLGFRSLLSSISGVLRSPAAYAVDTNTTPYDWGFNRYGIPARIEDNPAYDDPYANADYVVSHILTTNLHDEYVDRANKCFGVSILQVSGLWSVKPERDVNPNSKEYEEGNCGEQSENWDRLILFIHDSSTMEAAACFEGDQESCVIATGNQQ